MMTGENELQCGGGPDPCVFDLAAASSAAPEQLIAKDDVHPGR